MQFLTVEQVKEIHDDVLAETRKGLAGIESEDLIASAVNRPQDKAHYEPGAGIGAIAASLCFGIAKNHGFNDANKRTSVICTLIFLDINGYDMVATDEELFKITIQVADNKLNENDLAHWISRNIRAKSVSRFLIPMKIYVGPEG